MTLIDWHASTNMADPDELARLEAERDRLLSMIAHHSGPFYRTPPGPRAPAWFVLVAAAVICGIGISLVAAVFAGQISASTILFVVVGLPLLAYIFSWKITAFGNTVRVGEIFALFTGVITPVGQPAGEPQARQRLADCEARIMKLKKDRS
jgi:hypothetical protein